jgi:hypothetical protein
MPGSPAAGLPAVDTVTRVAEADFAAFAEECDLARRAVARASLDEEFTRADRTMSLRWVYTHMIEEYARHNGHADLLRQRVDGTTGS